MIFQNTAEFVEDTSAFQEEISQLDVAAWGNQVANELQRDATTTTTGQVNVTVDQAVRMTFPGTSAQNEEQSNALSAELAVASERLQQAVDAQRLIDILADAGSHVASDAGTGGLGHQDTGRARTTEPTSVSEEVFPGVDPQENEELLKAEEEFTRTFGVQLPSQEAAVNITQGYYLFFQGLR